MSAEFQKVVKLFEEVLRQPDARREDWLRETCSDEPELRREVEAMLAAHRRAGGILDRSLGSLISEGEDRFEDLPGPGERVGPYRLERQIGRGGMGVVYQAHDPRLDRFVALKFLPPRLHFDERAKARFLAEARAASALDHPNICTVHDLGEIADGRLYVVMAFYEGETLDRRIERGPLPPDEAVELARQVLAGLARAHNAGIVHRDVKPSNIMVIAGGGVKILDFGVAKLEGEGVLTEPGTVIGTPAYMAPEALEQKPLDGRSDLWSAGVVLYEMLTGERPFQGDRLAVLGSILHDEPAPLRARRPEIPEAFQAIVDRLLAKDPEARYGDAEEAVADLEALQTTGSLVASISRITRGAASRLPASRTSFVGRRLEIERLTQLVRSQARLVTLTGPAGTGKTRLAVRAALELGDIFPDGVYFVPLASVSDSGLVPDAIRRALGLNERSDLAALDHVKRSIARGRVLLVLDNFEQLVEGASVVAELLDACPELEVLATSRIPLRLSGEHEFPVPPLELPKLEEAAGPEAIEACASVALFVERARAVQPDFELDEGNARAVAELCVRLDGLPLAIELAAARIKLFSPQALLARLANRLDLLKGGPRDLPTRHQTLRGAIAWSYELLDDPHRRLFRRVSAFVGGCTVEAAEALCGSGDGELEVLEGLAALVDHSLLRREGGEPRFVMLETIRSFAQERLHEAGEADGVRQAHAEYFLAQAERAAPELTGSEQGKWLDRLEAEHGNLQAALGWAEERSDGELGLRLGVALWRFWLVRSHMSEGRRHLERALATPGDEATMGLRASALNGLGTLAHNQGDNREARGFLEESLELFRRLGDRRGMAAVLNNLAWVACELCDLDRAAALSDEALALCRELNDGRGVALALNNLGWVAIYRGEDREAAVYHEESLIWRRRVGDHRGAAYALTNIAWAELFRGNFERATKLLSEARDTLWAVKDRTLLIWMLCVQGQLEHARGRSADAVKALEESLALWQEGGNLSLRALSSIFLADVLVDQRDLERARGLYEEGLAIFRAIGTTMGIAAALAGLGRLARLEGDRDRALSLYRESLAIRVELRDHRGGAECLERIARVLTETSDTDTAVRLLGAAATLRERGDAPLPRRHRDALDSRLEELRGRLGDAEYQRIWTEGRRLDLIQAAALAGTGSGSA